MIESGLPGFDVVLYSGVLGPKGMDAAVVRKLNAEFAKVLGRVLHRPSVAPVPGFALRLLLGEVADALILNGQRVLPAKAMGLGFEFRHPDLASALRAIYGGAQTGGQRA